MPRPRNPAGHQAEGPGAAVGGEGRAPSPPAGGGETELPAHPSALPSRSLHRTRDVVVGCRRRLRLLER